MTEEKGRLPKGMGVANLWGLTGEVDRKGV